MTGVITQVRRFADAKPQATRPEEDVQPTLPTLLRALTTLEQDVHNAQALVQQLSASLDDVRRRVLTLSAASAAPHTPTMDATDKGQLRIYCFGAFEIFRDGAAIPQRRTGKGPTILKYLASRPRQPVLRDVLLEVLWPATAPGIANNRLKVAVHHLRQTFAPTAAGPGGDPTLLFQDGTYLFNPRIQVWTDVEAFRNNWQTGLRLERAGFLAEAIPFYQQAKILYRGDFLEEDLLEEWTLAQREQLKDTYLMILDKLSRYWFQAGEFDRAAEGWKKIVAMDAWREDAYRHLMVCYSQVRQRELALYWYNLCVQALDRQLSLGPEPDTVALYKRIRAGERIGALVD